MPTAVSARRHGPRWTGWPAALLWDMDGTLVDTEPSWFAAEHALVAEHGDSWTEADARSLVGSALTDSAQVLITRGGVRLPPAAVIARLSAAVREDVRRAVPWRPGARELLTEARGLGIPCALVTMSWADLVAAVLDALPEGTFDVVVTGDAVTRGKPHPEPYLTAAAALGLAPDRCLALEDSLPGVESALAAGVPTVGVQHHVALPAGPSAPDRLVVLDTLAGVDVAGLIALVRAAGVSES